jgi:hypothetical protein
VRIPKSAVKPKTTAKLKTTTKSTSFKRDDSKASKKSKSTANASSVVKKPRTKKADEMNYGDKTQKASRATTPAEHTPAQSTPKKPSFFAAAKAAVKKALGRADEKN